MEHLINCIDRLIASSKRFIEAVIEWWKHYQEKKRKAEIERLVTKLWRLDAIFKCRDDDLKHIKTYDKPKHEWYWIVDYHHKYIFGRDE